MCSTRICRGTAQLYFIMNREQAQNLARRIVEMSKADEISLSIDGGATTHLRFARNSPSTSGTFSELDIRVTSSFGKRSATAVINQVDDASLERGVRRSEEMARLAPEDPEHMPGLGPTDYPEVAGHDPATAAGGAAKIAAGVKRCISESAGDDLVAAGFSQTGAGFECIANSKGMFGYHRSSSAYIAETVRTADNRGSGWASASDHRVSGLDFAAVSAAAREKARRSANPRPLEPGKYVTILEPACVANLIGMMTWSMDRRAADEGRSFFSRPGGSNRLGEKLFPKAINLVSDPTDARAPGSPWGGDGLPQARRSWIENGAVKTLATSRFWAEKSGVAPIPGPSNLLMSGGRGTVDDLIKSTERGVLVTSLWYIRSLDPRTMTFTGLTRDGVFWIEDGAIKHPVTNFRWNDSPIAVLKNTVAMSQPYRVPPRPSRSTTTVVPALKVSEFTFASVSEAV
jgi:predicted Zn-dependent protease